MIHHPLLHEDGIIGIRCIIVGDLCKFTWIKGLLSLGIGRYKLFALGRINAPIPDRTGKCSFFLSI
jgi:hypothetical protein